MCLYFTESSSCTSCTVHNSDRFVSSRSKLVRFVGSTEFLMKKNLKISCKYVLLKLLIHLENCFGSRLK